MEQEEEAFNKYEICPECGARITKSRLTSHYFRVHAGDNKVDRPKRITEGRTCNRCGSYSSVVWRYIQEDQKELYLCKNCHNKEQKRLLRRKKTDVLDARRTLVNPYESSKRR